MRHRGPPSDTCCPLRGLPSTHATLHLASMTGVLGEEEEAQRRVEGWRGFGKNGRRNGVQKGRRKVGRWRKGERREKDKNERKSEIQEGRKEAGEKIQRGGDGGQKY